MVVRFRARFAAAFALVSSFSAVRPADAVVVERIVAVVGERAFLQTDLRQRARPFLSQLHARCPLGSAPCIPAENKIYAQLVERMVEDELEAQAAKRVSISVSSRDVDETISRIAGLNKVTPTKLISDVMRQSGMTEAEYRQELRRQVLEGKLLQRVVTQQMRITKSELEATYARIVEQERKVLLYQPAWIVLRLGAEPSAELTRGRENEAKEIVRLARSGSDFGQLARQYSEDPKTRELGGDLGVRAMLGSPHAESGAHKVLSEELEDAALTLEPGEVTEPFPYQDGIAVLALTNRQPSRYPSFEAAQSELAQRVQGEKLELAKRKWLKDLRKRTLVDVRL
ncbi:MAG: peptidylprolyl isomerase [Myxococcales bacterium]|nr:peptidylprolyl isomerase [Myxococcales bacterium]